MVRVTNDNKVYVKILFWGIKGAGKNTAADLLYDATKDVQKKGGIDLKAVGERTRMPIGYEEGLFSDRGIFQSTKMDSIFFHAYTFTGDPSIGNKIPKNLFKGTDGIVFLFDGQRARLNENADSLSFLEKLAGSDLIEKIPLTILLTKTDTPDAMTREEVEELLRTKGMMWEAGEPMGLWNPIIVAANLQDEGAKYEVYKAFAESARRAGLYQTFGSGSAPALDKNTRINLIIPEALKAEWERFSSEVVQASMSQMIRDAVREYMQKKEQPKQPPVPEPATVQNGMLEKRIEDGIAKKIDEIRANARIGIEYDVTWTIVVGGATGVGKTSFIHRYLHGEFLRDSKPAVGCQFHTQTLKRLGRKILMELWDFGSHYITQGKNHVCIASPVAAVLLLFDLSNMQSLEDLRKEWLPLVREGAPATMPVVLVGTKADLVSKEQLARVQAAAQTFVKENYLSAFKATSAKSGANIDDAITSIVELLTKGQTKQPPVPEPVVVQNGLSEKRIEDIVAKKMEELLTKRKADILFNQRNYPDALNTYLETIQMDDKEKVLSDLDNADAIMKLAYSYINVQDFDNAKKYLLEAKRLYTQMKKEAEIKVIDSTLAKLSSKSKK